jgi:hypothetical protein
MAKLRLVVAGEPFFDSPAAEQRNEVAPFIKPKARKCRNTLLMEQL